MELELNTLNHIIRDRIAITVLGTFIGKFSQVIGFELDAIDLIIATQLLDFFLAIFLGKLVLTILVTGKLVVKLLFGKLLAPLLFCSE